MSKQEVVVVKPLPYPVLGVDANVSMDDIVSAFVAKYENNLLARKKELAGDIKTLEQELEALQKQVLKEHTGSEYNKTLDFELVAKCQCVTIDWTSGQVNFSIKITSKADVTESYHRGGITVIRNAKLKAAVIHKRNEINENLVRVRADLGEILESIKGMARKERQIRGRIAMRKLEDSGYTSLMQDEQLAQLVQLEPVQ